MVQSVILPIIHQRFELKACLVKLQKISEAHTTTQHNDWLYKAIISTEKRIAELQSELDIPTIPFTAMQFKKPLITI
jgi:hypothetical protein